MLDLVFKILPGYRRPTTLLAKAVPDLLEMWEEVAASPSVTLGNVTPLVDVDIT
ncbi:hypothetical protein GAO09_11745 [Rhizobiales bacterium RZME27]|uniref:Uncharacterized protein n=1 Tax=Endobacterium cereale TaxID=2663029 RepID=A0A6A8ABX8_9HYPH|nr:hypothetical protein [Endobacterium cereale]